MKCEIMKVYDEKSKCEIINANNKKEAIEIFNNVLLKEKDSLSSLEAYFIKDDEYYKEI